MGLIRRSSEGNRKNPFAPLPLKIRCRLLYEFDKLRNDSCVVEDAKIELQGCGRVEPLSRSVVILAELPREVAVVEHAKVELRAPPAAKVVIRDDV